MYKKIVDSQTKFKETCNFVVSTVHADGLAPLNGREFASTLMDKLRYHIYMQDCYLIYQSWQTLHVKKLNLTCGLFYVYLWPVEINDYFHYVFVAILWQIFHLQLVKWV